MNPVPNIPGLFLQSEALSIDAEIQILIYLDALGWSNELKRRTIHRGYKYPYKGGSLVPTDPIEGLLLTLADVITSNRLFGPNMKGQNIRPDQAIVNEYLRDQGISAHTDRKDFGPRIAAFSLGADTNFVFRNSTTGEKVEIYVPPRSLMVMTGESRSNWTHEIPSRKSVNTPTGRVNKSPDYRRVSITYRSVTSHLE